MPCSIGKHRNSLASSGPTGISGTVPGDPLVALPAFTADGVSDYEIEIRYGILLAASAGFLYFTIAEGGARVGYDLRVRCDTVGNAGLWRLKFVSRPSAASHSYTVNYRNDGATGGYNINNTAPGGYEPFTARVVRV